MTLLRHADQWSHGMVTDAYVPGGLQLLRNGYVRRSHEICSRGPITNWTGEPLDTPLLFDNEATGFSHASFHPDFGYMASFGFVDRDDHELYSDIDDSTGYGFILNGTIYPIQAPSTCIVTGSHDQAYEWPVEKCISSAVLDKEIIFAGENGRLYRWGGAVGFQNAGTVSVVEGSRKVVGADGADFSNVTPGAYIMVEDVGDPPSGASDQNAAFLITEVIDSTTLEVDLPYSTSYSGKSYSIVPVALVQSPPGVWNEADEFPRTVGVCTSHQGRVFVAGVSDNDYEENTIYNFNRVRWSGNGSEISTDYQNHRGVNLWNENGYIDVSPGIGGAIRGLVSMGNDLIVLKSDAMFRITGEVGFNGTESRPVSVQMISASVGAAGLRAFAMTKQGLVVAHRSGLYLFDGTGLKNLLAGRMQRWWDENYRGYRLATSAHSDKVIVGRDAQTTSDVDNLVWQIEEDYFWLLKTNVYVTDTLSISDQYDRWEADVLFPRQSWDIYGTFHTRDLSWINHKKSYVENLPDSVEITVTTHPIPLGDGPMSEGRIDNARVHCLATGSGNPGMSVYLGTTATSLSLLENHTLDITAESGVDEVAIPSLTSASDSAIDRVWRVPMHAGHQQAPAACIEIRHDDSYPLHLYALGLDVVPSLSVQASAGGA